NRTPRESPALPGRAGPQQGLSSLPALSLSLRRDVGSLRHTGVARDGGLDILGEVLWRTNANGAAQVTRTLLESGILGCFLDGCIYFVNDFLRCACRCNHTKPAARAHFRERQIRIGGNVRQHCRTLGGQNGQGAQTAYLDAWHG